MLADSSAWLRARRWLTGACHRRWRINGEPVGCLTPNHFCAPFLMISLPPVPFKHVSTMTPRYSFQFFFFHLSRHGHHAKPFSRIFSQQQRNRIHSEGHRKHWFVYLMKLNNKSIGRRRRSARSCLERGRRGTPYRATDINFNVIWKPNCVLSIRIERNCHAPRWRSPFEATA